MRLEDEISQSIHNYFIDSSIYSHYCIEYNFKPKWKQFFIKIGCFFRGHKMINQKVGKSYCKKCLHEKVKPQSK